MDITRIDKNMAVQTVINKDGMLFYNVEQSPFRVYGVFMAEDGYRRIPDDVARATNEGVTVLARNTAGGRVRFVTDSPKIAISVKRNGISTSDNITPINTAGLDMYSNDEYVGTFRPGSNSVSQFESVLDVPSSNRGGVFTINFTDYGNINELWVGICEGSSLTAAPDYKYERPVVFYGSSITQGGCASRPGMAYEAILSRRLDMNYVNLGFSGSARAEPAISDYIRRLDMSVFVYDYDHNAPSVEHLEKTHERMFLEFRQTNPTVPVIMLTAPCSRRTPEWDRRAEIIRQTYDNAVARGDENVYFIHGAELFDEVGFEYTIDGCHPTDLGFWFMAGGIEPLLRKVLASLE